MKKLLLTTLIAGASIGLATTVHADTNVYRLYNPYTGEHFYTTSTTERTADINAGWAYEGVGWNAPSKGVGVYRVYNPNAQGGDHYYTKSKYEAQSLVNKGWRWDNGARPVFYSGGKIPVYVAYNPNTMSGAHNYTGSLYEENSLIRNGWRYKAVAWQAVSLPKTPYSPNNPVLQEFANEMNSNKNSLLSNSDGTYRDVKASVSGNTLIVTFTLSDNYGTLSGADANEMKSQMRPSLEKLTTLFKDAGVANPSVRYIFDNANGTVALVVTYP